MPALAATPPNIRMLRLLRGPKGFRRSLAFAVQDDVYPHLRRNGVKDNNSKMHCNVLFLVLMKRAWTTPEQSAKETLVRFLLDIGLSVLSSGTDHSGDPCLKYLDDLSFKTFSAVRNVFLCEYKMVFPEEYETQIAAMRTVEAVIAANILTEIKTAPVE